MFSSDFMFTLTKSFRSLFALLIAETRKIEFSSCEAAMMTGKLQKSIWKINNIRSGSDTKQNIFNFSSSSVSALETKFERRHEERVKCCSRIRIYCFSFFSA